MIEVIMTVCAIAGFYGAFSGRGGGGVARTPDECDRHEADFLKLMLRKRGAGSVSVAYLDSKRASLGFPRRPGVNTELLRKAGS